MSLPRLDNATHITDQLNELAAKVKSRSRASLTDANHILEIIAKRFFNALFGWDLVNLNVLHANYPATDLGDRGRRIAIQVTNEDGSDKIKHTTAKAVQHKLATDFDLLIVFFLLARKPGFPKDFIQPPDCPKVETWDIADLLKQMQDLPDLDALAQAAQVLDEEMGRIPVPPSAPTVAPTRLRHCAERLFGRDRELARLDAAWASPKTHVVSLVAWGGVGKTSLVARWLANMAEDDYRGAERVFDWTFYSQGTREQGGASADLFVNTALTFFGDPDPTKGSPWDKGERLARLVSAHRSLLVLDGLEPLQYPPGVPGQAGKLKDPAIECLLKGLAQHNRGGLCIVTTRESVSDLTPFRETTAPEWVLENLPEEAGAQLLHRAGANRAGHAAIEPDDDELKAASREVQGHALTLTILSGYLARAHGGDIRRRDRVDFQKADATVQGGHAFRALAAYERWLATSGEEGQRQLALLRLMGFFDRPADPPCLAALCAPPAIPGLTEPVIGLEPEDWNCLVSDLDKAGLLHPTHWEPKRVKGYDDQKAKAALGSWANDRQFDLGEPIEHSAASRHYAAGSSLDAHPLVREYFASRLHGENESARVEGHRRLYDHLKVSVPFWPEGADGLEPLYQAIAHGCQAGMHEQALDAVYCGRTIRDTRGPGGFYSTRQLGLIGSDLGAVACFFDKPWDVPSAALPLARQAYLLLSAAFRLRCAGRLGDARDTNEAAVRIANEEAVRIGNDEKVWELAEESAANLVELLVLMGILPTAIDEGARCVDTSNRIPNRFRRLEARATFAHALHQAARADDALGWFRDAEAIQAMNQPDRPLLYTVPGWWYCDLLLGQAERSAWRAMLIPTPGAPNQVLVDHCNEVRQRAEQTLQWHTERQWGPYASLDRLTVGRAVVYRALVTQPASRVPQSAMENVHAAVDGLRAAQRQDQLPRGVLTRAWARSLSSDMDGARADLDEAWEIAERGPMRLHMADIHLYRARLFFREKQYPWESPEADLAAAEKLINDCGYHRRDEELADAKRAILGR